MHCRLFALQRHEWFPGWAIMNIAVKSFSVNACFSEDHYFLGIHSQECNCYAWIWSAQFCKKPPCFSPEWILTKLLCHLHSHQRHKHVFSYPWDHWQYYCVYLSYSHRCSLTSYLNCSLSFSNGYQSQNSSCMLVCMFSLMNDVFIFHLFSNLVTVFPLELWVLFPFYGQIFSCSVICFYVHNLPFSLQSF